MQAIEFEATTFQHAIRVPDTIPDGMMLRVLLLVDDNTSNQTTEPDEHSKNVLASMRDVGDDKEFSRSAPLTCQAALAHIASARVDWQGKPIADRDAFYDDIRQC